MGLLQVIFVIAYVLIKWGNIRCIGETPHEDTSLHGYSIYFGMGSWGHNASNDRFSYDMRILSIIQNIALLTPWPWSLLPWVLQSGRAILLLAFIFV